ncbi:MAG: DMT family transporter [Nitrososphaerota archaeon]|jgi:drug/metabolite transporter (DMT)-like permease|nr:DMT family transporter [Nitrososphaerota archaeon]
MDVKGTGVVSERWNFIVYLVPFIAINSLMYAVAKDSLNYSQPFIFMSIRFAIASAAFYAIFRKSLTLPTRDMVVVGLVSATSGAAWLLGLNYVSSADSAVLSYTMPFFAMPLSYIILKERVQPMNGVGALLGIAGVLIYAQTLPPGGSTLVGVLLTLANAFFFALFTVYYRKLRGAGVGNVLFWQSFLSLLVFLPLTTIEPRLEMTTGLAFDIIFASVLGGVIMFYAWNMMARKENIGRLAALVYLVPVMAILYEYVLFNNPPGTFAIFGAAVMLFGVYISRFYGFGKKKKLDNRQ